ncbi:hypothetical protein [Hoeflea olei]|uniref:Uncharacterized protein n=1 Tax=Hoeflea olei TaxID=1480615 RepID=A0A1C1YU70_9HYPH|nr:hypothetical protein [Hoeflea olei]OCW57064.1 hypothetical protein AWJ14_07895 [Hoeflea olei]
MKVLRSQPLTEANLKTQNRHIYITALRKELPGDVFEIKATKRSPNKVTLEYEDLKVETYVPNDTRTEKPRNHFQARSFVGKFFTRSGASAGDVVLFTPLSPRHYRLSLERRGAAPPEAPDPRKEAVSRMARQVASTVAGANGQVVAKTMKNKERHLSGPELELHIAALIEEQGGVCVLSGLPLQFDGAEQDSQMLASLDRIDSNGHYAKGNLQVVCRFVNKWKSDMPDPEFRRLMTLVKDQGRG